MLNSGKDYFKKPAHYEVTPDSDLKTGGCC